MLTDIRIKILNFIRKYKFIIVIILVVWAVLIAINFMLTHMQTTLAPETGFTPYEPIIENGEKMPSKWQETIENKIAEYIKYCNQKEYEKAYNLISENAREKIYPTLQDFKTYVDYVFDTPKVYTIQNYSNRGNVYIYRIRIFDDILATGMNGQESFTYFEEKMAFIESNGKLNMSVKSYIGDEKQDAVYDDQYMRISVINKSMSYDETEYSLIIQNKTEYTLVFSNDRNIDEIALDTSDGYKGQTKEGKDSAVIVGPNATLAYRLTFNDFYDEANKVNGIVFKNVRVLRSYSGTEETKEKEIEEAISIFGFTLPLN